MQVDFLTLHGNRRSSFLSNRWRTKASEFSLLISSHDSLSAPKRDHKDFQSASIFLVYLRRTKSKEYNGGDVIPVPDFWWLRANVT